MIKQWKIITKQPKILENTDIVEIKSITIWDLKSSHKYLKLLEYNTLRVLLELIMRKNSYLNNYAKQLFCQIIKLLL